MATIPSDFDQFRLAAEFAPTHIIFTDPDGVIQYANPAAEIITGYSRKEMIGKHPSLWGGHMPKVFYENLWDTIKKKRKIFHGKIHNRRKNGTYYEAEMWIGPVQKGTKLIGFVGVEADISQYEALSRDLKKSEENLRQITENIKEGFFLTDIKSGEVLYISKAVKEIWGRPSDAFLKKPFSWQDFIIKEDRRIAEASLDAIAKGKEWSDNFRIVRPDGEIRWIHASVYPVSDDDGKVYRLAGVSSDVTELKQSQEKAQSLEVLKNKFIQIVSHQLRTPLTAIRWNLEILNDQTLGSLNDAQAGFTRMTQVMSVEIIRRLDDLILSLDIQQQRIVLNKELSSIDSIVSGVVGEHLGRCRLRSISCQFIPQKNELDAIEIDPTKIRLVLNRLVENAVDYTKEGGKIKVTLTTAKGNVRIEVIDTGIGIPQPEQRKIFTRFYRASNASTMLADASGLSLYIAKQLVEKHGGTIGFDSTEGKGSTFWIELPQHMP